MKLGKKLTLSLFAVLAMLILLFGSSGSSTFAIARSESSSALPAFQSTIVPAGDFIPIEIDAFSNNSWVQYNVTSNIAISIAFMNSNQFNQFNTSLSDQVSNSITYVNGKSSYQDLKVSRGQYFLVLYDSSQTQNANVSYTFQAYPNTPYNYGAITPPEPTGLASFGILNESGNAVPYSVNSSRVVGEANISSILAYNATAPSLNDTISGATLQLNSLLVVNNTNGQNYVYWVQNTPDFVTSAKQVSLGDNVWNNTDLLGFLSNSTINSQNGDFVYPTGSTNSSEYYYGYDTSNYTYALPFDLVLLINESQISGTGVFLQMGAQILANGTAPALSPVNWFDNITIHDPNVASASLVVDGNASTPVGSFYDTELVFAGEGNLEATQFQQLNSTLGLFYENSTSGSLTSYPSYYSFGGDTGESADNLHVTYSGNGTASVAPGTPNYVYLGEGAAISTTTSSSSSQSNTTTTSTSSSSSSTALTSTTSSSSSSSSSLAFSSSYLYVVVVVLLVAGGVFAANARRRRTIQKDF